jgi:hypothetical protein
MALGIATCYVATYEAPDRTRAKLTFAYDSHRRKPAADAAASFLSQRLVPDSVTRDDRPIGLVVAPLFFDGVELGFMLIELGKCEASAFYVLPALVSLMLHHAAISSH